MLAVAEVSNREIHPRESSVTIATLVPKNAGDYSSGTFFHIKVAQVRIKEGAAYTRAFIS